MDAQCCSNPRFFYCETVAVEADGTASVIMACTACGTAKATRITVSNKSAKMRLLNEEKKQIER